MELTHIDKEGNARMVDISKKVASERYAVAFSKIKIKKGTISLVKKNLVSKGDVLNTSRLAGIMAAKITHNLIPLCHPLSITDIEIDFKLLEDENSILIKSEVSGVDRTGFEMEALVGASIAALTIYDMCKAYDKEMEITETFLYRKSGGKSGDYQNKKKEGKILAYES